MTSHPYAPSRAMTFGELVDATVGAIQQRLGDGEAAHKALRRLGLATYAAKAKGFRACADCPEARLCRDRGECGGDAATKKLARDLDDALARIKAKPAKPTADVIYAQMMKRAVEMYPGETPAKAFAKSLKDAEQREAYRHYRKVWDGELPEREAAVEATRKRMQKSAPDLGPAYAALQIVAGGIRAAEPKLTVEQAFAKAARQRPDLWAAYRQEMRQRAA